MAAGSPASDRTVVVFPSDRALRVPLSRRIHVAQPGPDGRYSVRGLPPGEYLLAAVDGVETGEQFDPEFLQRLAPGARRVTLDAGAATVVNLPVR